MRFFRARVDLLIRRLKRDPEYTVDPSVPTGTLLRLLWARGLCYIRGLCWQLRLGSGTGAFFVGRGVRISNPRLLHVGSGVTLEDHVQIDALSHEGVHLGDNTTIARFTILEATGVISSLGSGLHIGSNSNLGDYCFIGAAGGVQIGSNVLIGQRVSFHGENHIIIRTDIPIKAQGVTRQGIVVEDDSWLGSGSIILDGVTVGRGAVVAAGSVVNSDVPPFGVVAGVPARLIRIRSCPEEGSNV